MKTAPLSLAAAVLAAPLMVLPAGAQSISGLYVGAGAGANSRQYNTFTNTAFGAGTRQLSYNWGTAAVGSLGWGFGNGIRAEIEGNFRTNEVAGFARPTTGATANRAASGRVQMYGVMGNALYDFNFAGLGISPRIIMPYVGVGVGYAVTDFRRVGGLVGTSGRSLIDDSAGRLAAQGIVGAAFPLDSLVPGLAATAEYRYFWSPSRNDINSVNVAAAGAPVRVIRESMVSANQSVMLGLRYSFNQPRPVALAAPLVAAPVQQVARTYLVFFDWNRADLTDRARQIIGDAAAARAQARSTRIEVAGHADTSGSTTYNQALSMRRAQAVAAELSRRGVPRSEINIQAFGETRPLVATGDNVREPQNRRVEIVIR